MLPYALHGYKIYVCTSTRETPFSLVYRMEVVLPIKVGIPSMILLVENKLQYIKWVQARSYQLNLIEE